MIQKFCQIWAKGQGVYYIWVCIILVGVLYLGVYYTWVCIILGGVLHRENYVSPVVMNMRYCINERCAFVFQNTFSKTQQTLKTNIQQSSNGENIIAKGLLHLIILTQRYLICVGSNC